MSPSVRRVALLAPMHSELRPLLRLLPLQPDTERPALHHGTLGRTELVATTTGIGVRAAARVTRGLLDSTDVDHVMVVGIAGGVGPSVEIGDLVVPECVLDLATRARHAPRTPVGFAPRGTLATSDALLTDPDTFRALDREGVVAVDMETAAIAAVCEEQRCPWSVFRAISDRADDGSVDAAIFGLTGPDGEVNLPALLSFLATRPWHVPRLVRLARGMWCATEVAARAATAALRERA